MKKHLIVVALLLTTVHTATAADWTASGSKAEASIEIKENTNITLISYNKPAHKREVSSGEELAGFALKNGGQTPLSGNTIAINVDQEYHSVSIAASGYYKMINSAGKSILVKPVMAPDWMKKGGDSDPMIAWSHDLPAGETTKQLKFVAVESTTPDAGVYKIGATAYYRTV
ncbi:hypothetical protein DXM49_24755 [Salmonella enterica]|nr:hypothetical protein [Salmonella enterica]EEB7791988.1 hypothetical protein [Salmonella enterica]EHW8722989.1 hypothetical protein [Salmonella enterica subsp. enterica serovar Mikawasima]